MLHTNLIFVDGLAGAGKSTTAQLLCLHLKKQGYEATWFYELDPEHPIYLYGELMASHMADFPQGKALHDQAFTNWQQFVAQLEGTNRIALFESALFQNPIGSLGLMGADRKTIRQYALQVFEVIQALKPVLIYLYQSDIPKAVEALNSRRGEAFGAFLLEHMRQTPYGKQNRVHDLQGVIAIFEHFKELTDDLFAAWPFPKIAIDTLEGQWTTYLGRITEFLSLPKIEAVHPPFEHLSDFSGRYTASGAENDLLITAEGQDLYLGTFPKFRLIHKAGLDFYVEGMAVELSFVKDDHGSITHFVGSGSLADMNTVWQKVA